MQIFYPSFLATKCNNDKYKYTIYVGIDETDKFYREYINHFSQYQSENCKIIPRILTGCEHKPAFAWNKLFEYAYEAGHDYFYQIGDDIRMMTPWVERFVKILEERGNKGVVGGCHDFNYYGRLNSGKEPVIENVPFVHEVIQTI